MALFTSSYFNNRTYRTGSSTVSNSKLFSIFFPTPTYYKLSYGRSYKADAVLYSNDE